MGKMKAAKAELRRARRALESNSRLEEAAGITRETPRFLRLNQAVVDAEKAVPWYRDEPREIRDRFRYRHDED